MSRIFDLLRRRTRRGVLSNDNELLVWNGTRYAFVCCVYSINLLQELTHSPQAHFGRRLGRAAPDGQAVYEVLGASDGFLALREDDTALIYRRMADTNENA